MDATFVEAPKRGSNPDVDAVARIVVTTADKLVLRHMRPCFGADVPGRDVATLHKTLLLLVDLSHLADIDFVNFGEHRSTVGSPASCAE